MSPAREERDRRRYRLLMRAYPRAQRERWGPEMEETFLALLTEYEREAGTSGRIRCWAGGAVDALARGTASRLRDALRATGGGGGGETVRTFVSDARHALRSLRRHPVFATSAILTLALGIGANASVFTVVNGLLFTPLPYREPHALVTLWDENPELGWSRTDVNPANAADWAARSRTLQGVAIYHGDDLNLTGGGPPELVSAVRTTPNLFRLLGPTPRAGRDFAEDEVGAGRDDVVILTHAFWTRRFGGDAAVLGRSIELDGVPRSVIGILPSDFRFLDRRADLFLPLAEAPGDAERAGHWANALGRLAEGATIADAQTELTGIARELEAEHPEDNRGWTVRVVRTHDEMVGPVARRASVVLMAAVGFVLLMACVNVANLLLASAERRSREMTVRAALGAGRGRLVGQLLAESLVLAAAGGVLGTLLAHGGYRAIVSALPSTLPPVFRFGIDASVIAFTAAATLGAALLFGVVPAVRGAAGGSLALRDAGRAGRSARASRFGSTLVVLQTASAVVLLVGGGLLMKSISGMRAQDFGFDPVGVLTARIAPPASSYAGEDELRAFWMEVEERVAALPGVAAAGTTQSHPLMGSNWGNTIYLEAPGNGEDARRTVRTTHASPGLFEALGFRMTLGRGFVHDSGPDAPLEVVVNQAFVDRYLGEGVDPLSRSILGDPSGETVIPIVGVVQNVVERGIDRPVEPAWYLPTAHAVARTRSLVVRTSLPPLDLVPAVERAVWAVDPNLPLFQVETMEALVQRRVGGYLVIARVMTVFALLSLVLGGVGIYGVTAYAAGRRTVEIGVRLAMGAGPADVVRLVVRQGALRAGLGLALGLGAAYGLARLLGSVLVGVDPAEPAVFLVVSAVLAGVAFLGLYLPARRAARVDPLEALAGD